MKGAYSSQRLKWIGAEDLQKQQGPAFRPGLVICCKLIIGSALLRDADAAELGGTGDGQSDGDRLAGASDSLGRRPAAG